MEDGKILLHFKIRVQKVDASLVDKRVNGFIEDQQGLEPLLNFPFFAFIRDYSTLSFLR